MRKLQKEFDAKISRNVRNYRITHEISQESLGKYLNLAKQAISRMENGQRKITIEELEKIALFFDQPIALFLKDEYKWVHAEDTAHGALPVFMAEFLEDYAKGLQIDAGKDNLTDKYTKRFIEAIKNINDTIKSHQKFKEKRERNNLH